MRPTVAAISAVVAAFVALAARGAAFDNALSPRDVLKMEPHQAAHGGQVQMRGVVTFVSALDGRFAVAPQDDPNFAGVVVYPQKGVGTPALGDLLLVKGSLRLDGAVAAIDAVQADRIRALTLPVASKVKQSDFRRGILYNRRIALQGKVMDVHYETTPNGPVSVIALYLDDYEARVRMPGNLVREEVAGLRVICTGLACSKVAEDGSFLEAELEMSGVDSIDIIDEDGGVLSTVLLCVLCSALAVVLVSLFVLWRRDVRVRREMSVVAEERRRMAADLHDTIEQHLAGANLLAAGVLALDDVPPAVVEAMKTLAGLLANAKAEVRSAVMNLRSAGSVGRTLSESLEGIAQSLEKTGVNARCCFRGLPNDLPEPEVQDMLLIVREATTNAVKHGKARTVVFTSDPAEDGGCVLRVLNDGVPFDPDAALGPETGHYGLSGMRERALRCGAGISWGRTGRWTYVELRLGRGKGGRK